METMLTNIVICGDCKDKMDLHIPSESVDLIYLDPPFFTKKDYEVIWKDGAEVASFEDTGWYKKICGNTDCGKDMPDNFMYCPKCGTSADDAIEVRKNDIDAYVGWLRSRLEECYRVLKPTGSMYVHLDHHAMCNVKLVMDEIFGVDMFKTVITWRRCGSKGNAKTFANNSDYILYYVKGKNFTFNIQYGEYSESTLKMYKYDDHDGRGLYGSYDISAPGGKGYKYILGYGEKCPAGGYRWKEETMLQKIEDDLVILKRGRIPRQKRYKSDLEGVPFDNVWTDIENVKAPIYPTEKPEALLERIIRSSSNPGDVVLDPFCGCGTALAAAANLGRLWLGIDVSPTACRKVTDRLHKIDPRIGIADIEDMPMTDDDMEDLPHFEFQNWVVRELGGRQVQKKGGDRGIDGFTFVGDPIQVKQSNGVGTPIVRLFAQDIRDVNKTSGIIVALSFGSGAVKEAKHIKDKHGISIELLTASDIRNGRRNYDLDDY